MTDGDWNELSARLRDLSRSMEGREAPPAVEQRLLTEFRKRRLRKTGWAIPLAIAATLAAAFTVKPLLSLNQVPPPPPAFRAQVAPASLEVRPARVEVASVKPRKKAATTADLPISPRLRPASDDPPEGSATEVATAFVPITPAAQFQDVQEGEIVRVRLPRRTMLNFGFPMNFDRMAEPVKADVLYGRDGIAHAIRFVQ